MPAATTRPSPALNAIVLAATPARRGAFVPAWALAAGRSICAWAVDALAASPQIARVALVVDTGHLTRAERLIAAAGWRNVLPVVPAEEAPGLAACLHAGLSASADAPMEGVVLHDGAHPLLPASLLDALVARWDGTGVVAAASPVKETLKAVDAQRRVRQTPPRDRLWQLHPPLLASCSLLERLLAAHPTPAQDCETPGAGLVALLARAPGVSLRLVPAGHDDLVVRRRADVVLAASVLGQASTPARAYITREGV